jgi:hypothetical protein
VVSVAIFPPFAQARNAPHATQNKQWRAVRHERALEKMRMVKIVSMLKNTEFLHGKESKIAQRRKTDAEQPLSSIHNALHSNYVPFSEKRSSNIRAMTTFVQFIILENNLLNHYENSYHP